MFTQISGHFCKIVTPTHEVRVLEHRRASRPAARFNRPGEDALYLTQSEESARYAMRRYLCESGKTRSLVWYSVSECCVLDLRAPEAAGLAQLASQRWDDYVAKGKASPSWEVAEWARDNGCVGVIDPSRQKPGLWHLALFFWNNQIGPQVEMVGKPTAIFLA
nr:RES family NAD+ phosphorylase [uncultured Cohaesibacter sp.]